MMKTAKLKKILESYDCRCLDKGASGHEKWYSPITDRKFGVPRHKTVELNTARAILKQAGIDEKI